MKERIAPSLRELVSEAYDASRLAKLCAVLRASGVFEPASFPTGLFPAVGPGSRTESTSGYRAAWVRDNVHIALAHLEAGNIDKAVKNASALASFFESQRDRFDDIIEKRKDTRQPMNRPHVRFNGVTGGLIDEKWPHAQNDALGYFLWFLCRLANEGHIEVTDRIKRLLADFVRYFEAISFWKDEDSGHWEEQRKIAASSVGAVNAGLRGYRALLESRSMASSAPVGRALTDELLDLGMATMNRILPSECIQTDPRKKRRYDAALLFLIDPLDIVSPTTADRILADVKAALQGEFGISRYLKDSYWGPDYRRIPEGERTAELSDDIDRRSAFAVEGSEAEWCIFDSIISIVYGRQFQQTGDADKLSAQISYFNRTLSQLVEAEDDRARLVLPEAYFLEDGRYVPNDHVPLQWAHANLWRASLKMIDSVAMT